MLQRYPFMRKAGYRRPTQDTDRLFKIHYKHSAGRTCDKCDPSEELSQEPRYDEHPVIHYGTIASDDSVIKHAPSREEPKQKHNAIYLEMEASGLTNNFPCLVIRGISDYANSHKMIDGMLTPLRLPLAVPRKFFNMYSRRRLS